MQRGTEVEAVTFHGKLSNFFFHSSQLVGIEDVGGDGDDMCFEAIKKVKVGYRGIFT